MQGVRLADITWVEAKELINEDTIVVLPIGGGTKEHGPQLPCGTDFYVTDYLGQRVVEQFPVVLLPTLPYAYYPAFVDWPGSVSISSRVFMDMVTEIIRPFIKASVKKFLIIDGGVSTHFPLKILSYDLHNQYGITLAVTNIKGLGTETEQLVCQQSQGGHADEAETSCMLAIRPELVKMDLAVEEYAEVLPGTVKDGILKVSIRGKMKTKNGTSGNSKLATSSKGEQILAAMVSDIIEFLHSFQEY